MANDNDDDDEQVDVRDSNGAKLAAGDSVQVIKDLNVRGSSSVIKRGTIFKNIRLTANDEEIESGSGKGTMVLKTCFVKKV
jgi:protein PhnA